MSDLKKYREHETILAVVVFFRCRGKFLLLKRSPKKKVDANTVNGVGGKVEPGESFLDAIVRETKEETGLDISPKKFVPHGLVQVPDLNNNVEWVIMEFVADLKKEVQIPESEDGQFTWYSPEEIKKLPMLADVKQFLQTIHKTPKAFALTFCAYRQDGEVKNVSSTVFS
ncbi:NUDIX domain-containing protein [Patescibacteria group bacterium]|nr:NUDIX domain-containing protein [Patescibacteria group bacterium]